jgi:hypothetical protein
VGRRGADAVVRVVFGESGGQAEGKRGQELHDLGASKWERGIGGECPVDETRRCRNSARAG